MKNNRTFLFLLWLPWLISSCADFQTSPFTDKLTSSGGEFNQTQKNRLLQSPVAILPTAYDGVLSLALLSDNHQNYNDLEEVVNRINDRRDVDFAVHTGDMTDNGYNFEYDAFIRTFSRLQLPSFVVIGNHDAIGKGRKIYRSYFGSFNYSFVYRGHHFIFFNNNRLEFLDEDWSLDWLTEELSREPGVPKIVFQHINYENGEAFTSEQSARMKSLYESHGVRWVVNGHRHVFGHQEENGVRYLQVPRVEGARYVLLRLVGSDYQVLECKGAFCENTH